MLANAQVKSVLNCPLHAQPQCVPGLSFRLGVDCRICWLKVNDSRYGAKFDRLPLNLHCVHIGETTRKVKRDGTTADTGCGCLPAYRCAKFGDECTLTPHVHEIRSCATCSEYVKRRKANPRRRHLAFHIYPAKGSTVWRRAVEQLRLRWHLFDGAKAVAVCTADHLESFDTVADSFAGLGANVFPVPNDSNLREVATWEPLWERILPVAGENDVAFYGHAKGVTRKVNPGCMTHRWASLLYSLNLDYWPDVEKLLERTPIVGAFKKTGYGFGRAGGRFHYSGTFYWVRLDDFRRRYSVSKPPRVWTGTESWPGVAYDVGEAGCVFGENVQSKLDLYGPRYWKTTVIPELKEWLQKKNH